jgi:signal transduction histidine kinase/CHASE3 domain sensor protein
MVGALRALPIRAWAAAPVGAILAVMAVVLAAAIVLSLRFGSSLAELRETARAAAELATSTNAVLILLDDAEMRQRDMLLMAQPALLRAPTQSAARLPALLDQVEKNATADEMRKMAVSLRATAIARWDAIQRAGLLLRSDRRDAAIEVATADLARTQLAEARRLALLITSAANREWEQRSAELAARETETISALSATAAIGCCLLGFAALHLLAGRARLRRAQRALESQSQRLQGTVDHIRDGVAVFDGTNRLVLWNATFFPRIGLPEALAHVGTHFADLVAAAADWKLPRLDRTSPSASSDTEELQRGSTVLEIWRRAMPDGGQMIAIADITRRIEAERLARQAQKLQTLGHLTGGVAHDFNNLLQVISVNLEMLEARLPDDGVARGRLAAALAGVERGAKLVRHLLAFARRQPLAPQTIDPTQLLLGMDDLLRRSLGQYVDLAFTIEDALWPVRADPQQLENAVLNLAINARDAMPDGGDLSISACNKTVAGEAAPGWDLACGDYVMISVSDSGVGMTPEQITRAVEPFYTTKPEGRGTGLGLSMVYGFAKQSGGAFRLVSAVGRGTTATLCLPRCDAAPTDAPASDTSFPGESEAVLLLVEPDQALSAATVNALAMQGFSVIEAGSADAAVALLSDGRPARVLLINAGSLGDAPTMALAQQAWRIAPDLPVVVMNGSDRPPQPVGGAGRVMSFIRKPWRIEDLVAHLRGYMPAVVPTARPSR